MRGRRWKIGASIGLVGVAVASVMLVRSGLFDAPHHIPLSEMTAEQLTDAAQVAFSEMRLVDFSEINASEELRQVLSIAPLHDASQAPPRGATQVAAPRIERDRVEVTSLAADFIFYRFGQPSLEEYKSWRRSLGYELAPSRRLIDVFRIPRDYEDLFDEPYPGGDRFEEVFDRFVQLGATVNGDQGKIVGCCADLDSMAVSFGYETSLGERELPWFTDGLGKYLWHGKSAGSWTNWWTPDEGEYQDVLQQQKALRLAEVGVIVQYASGKRLPLHISFYFYPPMGRWRLRGAGVSNDYWDDRGSPNAPW